MDKYLDIPIETAKQIANDFEKDQVIIVCWDKKYGKTHVTTYGKTIDECKQAALGGNLIKKTLGWPDELCHDTPSRIKK